MRTFYSVLNELCFVCVFFLFWGWGIGGCSRIAHLLVHVLLQHVFFFYTSVIIQSAIIYFKKFYNRSYIYIATLRVSASHFEEELIRFTFT
jgi:hypothetical protein